MSTTSIRYHEYNSFEYKSHTVYEYKCKASARYPNVHFSKLNPFATHTGNLILPIINSPHNKLFPRLAAAPCIQYYAYKDFSCFNDFLYTGYHVVEGMLPPGLHHRFSNLLTTYGGEEEAISHWKIHDMHIIVHEKWRGVHGFYGIQKKLHTWRLQWSSNLDDSAAWRWTWKNGSGYRFSLVGVRRSRFTREFLTQWGRLSGAMLFNLEPSWFDQWEESDDEDEQERPEGPPAAPGEGAPAGVPGEVPREAPTPAPVDISRDTVDMDPVRVPMEAPVLEANLPAKEPEIMEVTEDDEVTILEPNLAAGAGN